MAAAGSCVYCSALSPSASRGMPTVRCCSCDTGPLVDTRDELAAVVFSRTVMTLAARRSSSRFRWAAGPIGDDAAVEQLDDPITTLGNARVMRHHEDGRPELA